MPDRSLPTAAAGSLPDLGASPYLVRRRPLKTGGLSPTGGAKHAGVVAGTRVTDDSWRRRRSSTRLHILGYEAQRFLRSSRPSQAVEVDLAKCPTGGVASRVRLYTQDREAVISALTHTSAAAGKRSEPEDSRHPDETEACEQPSYFRDALVVSPTVRRVQYPFVRRPKLSEGLAAEPLRAQQNRR
jgi:hypothetical protein